MTTSEIPSPPPKRRLRYFLISLAAFAVTIAIFYAEEDRRGWTVREQCLQKLRAEGVELDWQKQIPPAVPNDQNVFGLPEMQEWFVRKDPRVEHRSTTNFFTLKLTFPGFENTNRIVVAHVTVAVPGTNAPEGAVIVNWGDLSAGDQIAQAITNTLGPVAIDPIGAFYIKYPLNKFHPAQIYLLCQTNPSQADLKKIIPETPLAAPGSSSYEHAQVENFQPGSCDVTMFAPSTAAEYLNWWKELEPQMLLIRKALRRPYARMNGEYDDPIDIPIPNFVAARALAQRTVASARCHLLLGQPEEALRDLTFLDDYCQRVLVDNKPMTLFSAMINAAVRALSDQVIVEALQSHAWKESQLAALEKERQQINILAPVGRAFALERAVTCNLLNNDTPNQYLRLMDEGSATPFGKFSRTIVRGLIPRGWCWQNMANASEIYRAAVNIIDLTNLTVQPGKGDLAETILGQHRFILGSIAPPYFFMAAMGIPNFKRAAQVSSKEQTLIDHTAIACALERYRLVHAAYPSKLDDLVPQFINAIPHDLIGGKLPRYRRNPDGTFLLYSTGWDQKDHGGDPKFDYVFPETQ